MPVKVVRTALSEIQIGFESDDNADHSELGSETQLGSEDGSDAENGEAEADLASGTVKIDVTTPTFTAGFVMRLLPHGDTLMRLHP